jgi:molecular chaperone DnaK (HSP70)
MSRYLIGIDLGTTNSAVAYIDAHEISRGGVPAIHIFQIPQLVAEGEPGKSATLPSFIYFAGGELAEESLRLPWQDRATSAVGVLARDQGALVPGRQVSSAKSWLSHAAVDRTAKSGPISHARP